MIRNFLWLFAICFSFSLSSFSSLTHDPNDLIPEILRQTNALRKSQGLPELELRQELNVIAQKHSSDMATGVASFGHAGYENRAAETKKKIKKSHAYAENVAYGPSTATEVFNLWKKSPIHLDNILGKYKYIGIGIAADKNGYFYYTEIFAR